MACPKKKAALDLMQLERGPMASWAAARDLFFLTASAWFRRVVNDESASDLSCHQPAKVQNGSLAASNQHQKTEG